MTLRAYQEAFLADLYGGTGAAEPHVTGATAHRLPAYREGLRSRYEESLLAAFPAVERLVGHALFHRLCREFTQSHPSTTWDLGRVGVGFDGFLAAHPDLAGHPYVGETARLEQMLHEVFFIDDPLPPAHAPGANEIEAWRPRFAPTLRLFESAWDVVALYGLPAYDEGAPPVDVRAAPMHALVYRRSTGIAALRKLSAAQHRLQASLLAGATFGETLDDYALTQQDMAELTGLWAGERLLR